MDKINIEEVLAHSALKVDPRSDAADIKKEMDKQKNWYVEATAKMGLAHLCLGNADAAEKTLLDLLRVAEPTESRVVAFAGFHAESVGHLGRAMKLAIGQLEAKPGNIDLENRYVLEWRDFYYAI